MPTFFACGRFIYFSFGQILGLFALFGLFGAIFEDRIRFKNIFGTYLCRQSTLVLEVQLYLVAFTSVKFGAFLALFGPFGAIFGVGVRFKNLFGICFHSLTTFILEV